MHQQPQSASSLIDGWVGKAGSIAVFLGGMLLIALPAYVLLKGSLLPIACVGIGLFLLELMVLTSSESIRMQLLIVIFGTMLVLPMAFYQTHSLYVLSLIFALFLMLSCHFAGLYATLLFRRHRGHMRRAMPRLLPIAGGLGLFFGLFLTLTKTPMLF